jgi:hypothetical protein
MAANGYAGEAKDIPDLTAVTLKYLEKYGFIAQTDITGGTKG